MKMRTVWMSAALAGFLAASGAADAQLRGGGATAGGTMNVSLRSGTDALDRVRDPGSRATELAEDAASAGADVAGDASSSVDARSTTPKKPAKPQRATRESRRQAA